MKSELEAHTNPRKRPAPTPLPAAGKAQKDAPQRMMAGGHPPWLRFVKWSPRNTCHVDAPLKALHLARCAVAEKTARPQVEGQVPPPLCVPAAMMERATSETSAPPLARPDRLGTEMRTFFELAAVITTTAVGVVRGLDGQRDVVRTEIGRALQLRSVSSGSAAAVGPLLTERAVLQELRRTASHHGSVIANLDCLLHVAKSSSSPESQVRDFLGGKNGGRQCVDCGQVRPSQMAQDCSLHALNSHCMRAARGNPIGAFSHCWATDFEVAGTCTGCQGSRMRALTWFSAQSIGLDAPPLLALCWDVNDSMADELLLPSERTPLALDTAARDAARLDTLHGSVTYRLVALIYGNGSHFAAARRRA